MGVEVGRADSRDGGMGASPLSLVIPAPGARGQDPLLLGALGGEEGRIYTQLLVQVWLSGASTHSGALDHAGEQPWSLGENCQYFETAGALTIIQSEPQVRGGRSIPRLAVRNFGMLESGRLGFGPSSTTLKCFAL